MLIIFFSAMSVSLVVLIIFFSLFFENIDVSFNTRLPEAAPALGDAYVNPNNKQDEGPFAGFGFGRPGHAVVNVPSDPAGASPVSGGTSKRPAGENQNAVPDEDGLVPLGTPTDVRPDDEMPLMGVGGLTPDQAADDVILERSSRGGPPAPPAPAGRNVGPNGSDAPVPRVPGVDIPSYNPPPLPSGAAPMRNPTSGAATSPVPASVPTRAPAPKSAPPVPLEPMGNQAPQSPSAMRPAAEAPTTQVANGNLYQVYLDGFSSREAAEAEMRRLQARGLNPVVRQRENGAAVVQLGAFSSRESAEGLAGRTGAKIRTQ
jgi:cell division septation protein DedD